jgi:RNase P/RNase MRP subunit POP5
LLRSKKRYLHVEVVGPAGDVSRDVMEDAVSRAVSMLGGWIALAEAELRVLKPRGWTGRFIARCSLRQMPTVLLALTLIREIEGRPVAVLVTRSSGTIKKLLG